MVDNTKTHEYFTSALEKMITGQTATRADIALLRREMDAACDRREISLKAWRQLLDAIATIQAKLPR